MVTCIRISYQKREAWESRMLKVGPHFRLQPMALQICSSRHKRNTGTPPPQHISAHEVLWCQILIEGDIWSVKHPAEKKASQETSKKQGCPELWASQRLVAWRLAASSLTGGSQGADGGEHTLSAIYRSKESRWLEATGSPETSLENFLPFTYSKFTFLIFEGRRETEH